MPDMQDIPARSWWGQLYRGLVVDPEAKHYRRMRNALWLFAYFVIHANRQDGTLRRKYDTIASDMGVSLATIRRWMTILRHHNYISVTHTGRSQLIHIAGWKTTASSKPPKRN